jgi:hypothetical protein
MALAAAIGLRSSEELYRGSRYQSPDGRYVASFYGIGGGGAAGWTVEHVSVGPVGSALEDSVSVLELNGAYEACIYWNSNNHLSIEFPDDADVIGSIDTVNVSRAIHITLRAVTGDEGLIVNRSCSGRIGKIRGVADPWQD